MTLSDNSDNRFGAARLALRIEGRFVVPHLTSALARGAAGAQGRVPPGVGCGRRVVQAEPDLTRCMYHVLEMT